MRRTISVPAKIACSADTYRIEHPTEAIRDFSDFTTRALAEYIEKRQPGLLDQTAYDLRNSGRLLKVAESQAAYKSRPPKPPDKPSRRRGAGPAHHLPRTGTGC